MRNSIPARQLTAADDSSIESLYSSTESLPSSGLALRKRGSRTFYRRKLSVSSLTFSPDEEVLATRSESNRADILLWSTRTWDRVGRLRPPSGRADRSGGVTWLIHIMDDGWPLGIGPAK